MADKGSAFVKGGLGCLGGFIILGLLAVMLGGRMRIDVGGAICLFVCGGLIGLVVLWIYNRGQDAAAPPPSWPPDSSPPQSSPPPSSPQQQPPPPPPADRSGTSW